MLEPTTYEENFSFTHLFRFYLFDLVCPASFGRNLGNGNASKGSMQTVKSSQATRQRSGKSK